MTKLGLAKEEQDIITKEILHREAELNRKWRLKVSIRDFEPIAIIGKGAFGEVRLVRAKKTNEILAMKKMKKNEMIAKNQVQHVKAERDVLTKSTNNWIVDLKYSFQDENHLYLVMEYLPGGDLMTLLIRKEILQEEEARFYMSEIVLAIDNVHKLNYIHRDLKPDNVLIDKEGHIKLSDFGLCKHAEIKPLNADTLLKKQEMGIPLNPKTTADKKQAFKRNRQLAFSTVGTPDYIAPEVFGQGGYNEAVDWWSAGVILFEMLVGYPPFFSDDPSITCQKIIHWKKTLVIPPDANLSPAATDLIRKLICDADHRLGKSSVEEIKTHPFFEGVDWEHLKNNKSPYVPAIKSETDTSNFDKFEEDKNNPFYPEEKKKKKGTKIDINFIGYTFQKDFQEEKDIIMKAFEDPQVLKALQIEISSALSKSKGKQSTEVDHPKEVSHGIPQHTNILIHPPIHNASQYKEPVVSKEVPHIKESAYSKEPLYSSKESSNSKELVPSSDASTKKVFQIPNQQVSKPQIQTVYPSKINASTKITIGNMPSNNNSKLQTPMQNQIAGKPINSSLNKAVIPKFIPAQQLSVANQKASLGVKPMEGYNSKMVIPSSATGKKPGK